MTYTDQQLKQTLAKMLPELVYRAQHHDIFGDCIMWSGSPPYRPVRDTELLHLCWLAEQRLTKDQAFDYYICELKSACASWQQRTIALAKVKGVEIV